MKAGTDRRRISRRIEPPPFRFNRFVEPTPFVTATITETDDTIVDKTDRSPKATVALDFIGDEPERMASITYECRLRPADRINGISKQDCTYPLEGNDVINVHAGDATSSTAAP